MTTDEMYKSIFMDKPWIIKYDDFDLEVNVRKREYQHDVKCSFYKKGTYQQAYNSIFRFFNELIWFYYMKLSDLNGGHSVGSHVFLNYRVNSDSYLVNFKQKVSDEKQHLALGFYREATCNESPYYRFLCFAKILEIHFEKKRDEKTEWVDHKIKKLKGGTATTFRDRKVKALGNRTLSHWLHHDGRHAVAHGWLETDVVRDPNSYDDWDEIKWANEVMQELAECLIVEKLNVQKRSG